MSWRNQLVLAALLAIISSIVGGSIYLSSRAKEIKLRHDCAIHLQALWYALDGYRIGLANGFPPGSVRADGVPLGTIHPKPNDITSIPNTTCAAQYIPSPSRAFDEFDVRGESSPVWK